MRVLIAGATGAIGAKLVPALVERGHEVIGTSRSADRAADVDAMGGRGVVCDALDREAMIATARETEPEIIVHQLTALPKAIDPKDKSVYGATDRLRREGTANLMAAAQATGVRKVVAQSIAFMYKPEGDWVKTEDAPVQTEAPEPFGPTVRSVMELERQVTETEGIEGTVLRYGWLYGPGTYYDPADGFIAGEVRKRRYPIIGSGEGVSSFIHTDDAAALTVAAIEKDAPGIYNAVDDDPIAMREWLPLYAEAIGAKKPLKAPRLVVRMAAGPVVAALGTDLRGASNAKGKEAFGWTFRFPSVREGFSSLASDTP